MFDAKKLFKERLTEHIKLLNRYLRYVFNEHFMFALLFIIIALAVYYQKWLKEIPEYFPGALVIAILLGVVVSYNPIQSFLKEPDQVFIIVKEHEMYQYFRLSLLYNFIFQLYMIILSLAVVGPLYSKLYPDATKLHFLLLIVMMLLLKGWNMAINWMMFKVRNPLIVRLDKGLRTVLSIGLIYFFLQETFVWLMVILYFAVVVNDYILTKKQGGLAWDVLIENDQHRLAAFYRFVSMFAEVPQLSKRLRKRRIFSKLVNSYSPFTHKATFDYLYRLTFIRSNDYFNLFIRLTVMGGLLIFFIPNLWMKIVLAILFLYMTSFQLIPLYNHYRTTIWLDLYPIDPEIKIHSFLKGSMQLCVVQTIIFAAIFLISQNMIGLIVTLIAGFLFNYIFHHSYVKKRIRA